MSEWSLIATKEFCDNVKDGTHDSPKKAETGYPLITSKHLKNGQILFEQAYLISREDYLSVNKRSKVDKWDVLMSMIGTVGEVCLVKNEPNYAIKNMALFKCGDESRGRWLYYFLISKQGQQLLKEKMTGSSQGFVSLGDLRNLEIICPPKIVREKILKVITCYDNFMENNSRRIAILEKMAQQLYREWFVHFRFPGHENVKMVDSELGMIPEGWQAGKIGDICDRIFSGGTPTTTKDEYWNGDLPWLSSGETRNSFIIDTEKSITELGVDNSSTRKANAKDVVIASAGQGKTRGQTSFLLIDTYINQSVIALRGKENASEYLFINIKSRYPELRSASDSSSIRGSITTGLMSGLDIIIPDDGVLKKFSDKVSFIIKQITILQKKNNTLLRTRDILLPRLISGDINVSKIEI